MWPIIWMKALLLLCGISITSSLQPLSHQHRAISSLRPKSRCLISQIHFNILHLSPKRNVQVYSDSLRAFNYLSTSFWRSIINDFQQRLQVPFHKACQVVRVSLVHILGHEEIWQNVRVVHSGWHWHHRHIVKSAEIGAMQNHIHPTFKKRKCHFFHQRDRMLMISARSGYLETCIIDMNF